MFGSNDDFFGIFPDMDLDGDHDMVDFLIWDEIENRIQQEIEERDVRPSSLDTDDEEDETVLFEYGIDREDYLTEEDYLEAVDEAKYGWRDTAEDGAEFNLDPEDFETLEEYEDALEEAQQTGLLFNEEDAAFADEDIENDDSTSISIPLSFSIEVSYPGKDQLERIKETDYSNKRTYDAAYALCEIEYGDPYVPSHTTKEAEAKRHRFVLSQSCVAARYLTRYDGFIFVQAVKDHFRLPIDVPDEDNEVKNYFPDFFMELAEKNVDLALDVWVWCIKEFGAYQNYMENTWTLYNSILSSLDDYPDEFREHLIDRLGSDRDFRRGLLSDCPDIPFSVSELIVRALKTGKEKVAQVIFIATMKNSKAKSKWKEDILKRIISECSNWEELETMETFQKNIMPIVERLSDKRIQRLLPKMVKEVDDYIRYIESSKDKYRFSRRFLWRASCIDGSEYGISPLKYETEEEYLSAIEERKYSWRKYCNKRFGVSPEDYETRQEYDEAVKIAAERETQIARELRDAELIDTKIYHFCKVSLEYPYKPYYYYLVGDLSLKIGDRVIVPFGQNNVMKEAVVMSVGECVGCIFPCKIENIKFIKEKRPAF